MRTQIAIEGNGFLECRSRRYIVNQREVAEILGLSRAMVQKIEERALLKLRYVLIARGILKEDLL